MSHWATRAVVYDSRYEKLPLQSSELVKLEMGARWFRKGWSRAVSRLGARRSPRAHDPMAAKEPNALWRLDGRLSPLMDRIATDSELTIRIGVLAAAMFLFVGEVVRLVSLWQVPGTPALLKLSALSCFSLLLILGWKPLSPIGFGLVLVIANVYQIPISYTSLAIYAAIGFYVARGKIVVASILFVATVVTLFSYDDRLAHDIGVLAVGIALSLLAAVLVRFVDTLPIRISKKMQATRLMVRAETEETIAGLLHDTLAQSLVEASILLRQCSDRGATDPAIRRTAVLVEDSLTTLRQLTSDRGNALSDRGIEGTLATSSQRLSARAMKLRVEGADQLDGRLSKRQVNLAEMVLGECLANAMKYGRQKSTVTVSFDLGPDECLEIEVRNEVSEERLSLEGASGHSGLARLTGILSRFGGSITAWQTEGRWMVLADIPRRENSDD